MAVIFKADKYSGLTDEQVRIKLEKEGFNELPSSKPKNIFQIALGVVKEPMFLLLVACGTIPYFG
jgi:Ca2+-transporting ATPase